MPARDPEITLAIVYGAVTQGRPRLDSDIDIAVKSALPLTTEQTIRLVEDLATANGRSCTPLPPDIWTVSRGLPVP